MASEGEAEARTSATGTMTAWCASSVLEDLFTHAHQTLLSDDPHQQQRQEEGKHEEGVRERKRKRRKERIRHIKRTEGPPAMHLPPAHPLLVSVAALTPKDERLSPQPATGPPSGVKKMPPRPSAALPPLLPRPLPPPATPSPPPRPQLHSQAPTPPLTRSLPPSPTPPFTHSPSPTRRPSPPASTHSTPSTSPSASPPCLTPAAEETEAERRRRRKKVCGVCGDVARSLHFGGRACDSCKAFFRRAVMGSAFLGFNCVRRGRGGDGGSGGGGGCPEGLLCEVTVRNRKECQFCRFAACLKAGMEVSLATREDEGHPGLAPAQGLYRRLARHAHAHASTLHGAPYLAGCWRPPHGAAGPVLTPRLKEEPARHSLTGAEAAHRDAALRLAAAPPTQPASTPLVLGYSHPLPHDPAPRYAHSASDHHRPAPELSRAFSHDLDLDVAPRHGHDPAASQGHQLHARHARDPAPSHRRPPSHTRQPPTTTHTVLKQDPPQVHVPSANLSAMAAHSQPSCTTRLSKWSKNSPTRRPDPVGGATGGEGACPSQPGGASPRHDTLTPQDIAEIKQLQESYIGDAEVAAAAAVEECVPRSELGRLYMCFIERRAKFLVGTPLYGTVAAADRARLLHVAVAMSTYFTGAHHIDTSDYSWQQRRGAGPAGREVAVLSASSVRQLLSHQQFLHVMKFYTRYSEALADHTVTVLMQVMSLFYPEDGLQAPHPVEEGRRHYLALLSRYLASALGPQEGACRLATLLSSQQEARQLVEILRQVDMTPREPRSHLATSKAMLADRINLVCEAARGGRTRHWARGGMEGERPATTPPRANPEAAGGAVDQAGRILARLAQCEDPHVLAEARRILPAPLLRRFLRLLLTPAPHAPHAQPQCTPLSPSPSPPSPQCRTLSIIRHAGEPPPATPAPGGLQHLPAASHTSGLAAE